MIIEQMIKKNTDTKTIAKIIIKSAPLIKKGAWSENGKTIICGIEIVDRIALLDIACGEFKRQLLTDLIGEDINSRKV